MVSKLLTEREAWLLLAKLWDNPKQDRQHNWRVVVKKYYDLCYGLCSCLTVLIRSRQIDDETWDLMEAKIPASNAHAFVWPRTRTGARSRAAFCRKQAKALNPKPKQRSK